jgi:CDP-2,3-bis-(O-geranylgeranyl)-sn-glycerol synthase
MIEPLALLVVANGMPIIGFRVCGHRGDWSVDLGRRLRDGRRIFGASKSWRGLALALGGSAAAAELLGLGWRTGLLFGAWAMAGDLLSSFTKRRVGWKPGTSVLLLDQLPEALLPLLAMRDALDLTLVDALGVTFVWFWLDLALSMALYRLRVRKTPY